MCMHDVHKQATDSEGAITPVQLIRACSEFSTHALHNGMMKRLVIILGSTMETVVFAVLLLLSLSCS